MVTGVESRAITAKYVKIRNDLRSKYSTDRRALEAKRLIEHKVIEDAHKAAIKEVHDVWFLEQGETYNLEREEKAGPGTEAGQR